MNSGYFKILFTLKLAPLIRPFRRPDMRMKTLLIHHVRSVTRMRFIISNANNSVRNVQISMKLQFVTVVGGGRVLLFIYHLIHMMLLIVASKSDSTSRQGVVVFHVTDCPISISTHAVLRLTIDLGGDKSLDSINLSAPFLDFSVCENNI